MEPKSIKETKELFEGLAEVAKTAKAVANDGKVDFSDLSHVVALATNSSVLVAAVKDVNEVPEEIKDLSKEELLELIGIIYKKVSEVEKV
jgi:hypothetical protein